MCPSTTFRGVFKVVAVALLIANFISLPLVDGVKRRSSIQWVPQYEVDFSFLESAGPDIYIGRSNYLGGILPGELNPGLDATQISLIYETNEIVHLEYKALVYPKGAVTWFRIVNASAESLVNYAVQGGFEPFTFEPSYLCRTVIEGSNQIAVGKLLLSQGYCVYSRDGVRQTDRFELLVRTEKTFYEDPELGVLSEEECTVNDVRMENSTNSMSFRLFFPVPVITAG